MANVTISELNPAETVNDNDLMLISSYNSNTGDYDSAKISGTKLKQVFGAGGGSGSCGLSSEIITQLLNRKICKIYCKYMGNETSAIYPSYIKLSDMTVPIGYDFNNKCVLFEFPYQLGSMNIDSNIKGITGLFTYSELNEKTFYVPIPSFNILLTHNTVDYNIIDLYVIVYDRSNNIVARIGDYNQNGRSYHSRLYTAENIDIQWVQSTERAQASNILVNTFDNNNYYFSVYAHIWGYSRTAGYNSSIIEDPSKRYSQNFTTYGVSCNIVYNNENHVITPTTTGAATGDGKGIWKILTFDNGTYTVNNEYMTDSSVL